MMPDSQKRRVMVTGLGAVTPLGPDTGRAWRALIAGQDAAAPVTLFDTTGCRCRMGATAGLPPLPEVSEKKRARLSRASQLAIPAAQEALRHAGLLDSGGRLVLDLLPLSVSTSAGGMALGEEFLRACIDGRRKSGQFYRVARYQPQQQALDLQEVLGFSGPVTVIANACAGGANAIGQAADWIRLGWSECVLAGGYEALTELLFVGFDCIQAMTQERCRPFDRRRSGLMMGEAAAFFVLESEAHALGRGAGILCELSGYGQSTDLHHLTQPGPSGEALVRAMEGALSQAGLPRDRIGYVNAHGTGTVLNDAAEGTAYQRFFQEDLPSVRVSSTKAAIGHTLGAAGSVEALFAIQAILSGEIPPQINLAEPEPCLKNNLARPGERRPDLEAAMSVNLGFGGSNAALVFSKYDSKV